MRVYMLALLASAALAGSAYATPGNNGGGQGGCGVGQQTNGCGTTNNPTANGGDAQAGAVGVGIGVGVGIAGAEASAAAGANATNTLIAPISNDVRNDNRDTNVVGVDSRNTNANVNGQDQGQGQLQGQQQGIVGSGNSSSSSGSSSSSDQDQTQGQSQSNDVRNAQGQTQSAASDQRQQQGIDSSISAVGAGNTTDVTVEGDTVTYEAQKRTPVASAYSAPLSIGGGVCAYTPVSGAGQFVSFGLSGSAAKIDEGCERRATADVFARIGMTFEACQIMASAKYAVAAGIVCTRPVVASYAPPSPQPAPHVPATMLPIPDPVLPKHDGERGR